MPRPAPRLRAVIIALAAGAPAPAAAEVVRAPACGEGAADHAPEAAPPPVRTLRAVDWCNAELGAKGPLRRGVARLHLYGPGGGAHDTITTQLRGVVYGDLDGDRRVEAAVVLSRGTWIAARPAAEQAAEAWSVRVYRLEGGAPALLATLPADAPVHAIAFRRAAVTITAGAPRATTRHAIAAPRP